MVSQEWMGVGIKINPHFKMKFKIISTINRIKRRFVPSRRTKPFNNPSK